MGCCGPLVGCCIRNAQPNIKPRGAGFIMVVYGILVILMGIYLVTTAASVKEVVKNYTNEPYGNNVNIPVTIPEDMPGPVYVYLNFVDFYQNHRAMMSSFSRKQLENKGETESNLKSICSGAYTNKEMGKDKSFTGVALDPNAGASPCGYMARNFPLDEYKSMTTTDGLKTYPILDTDLIMPEEAENFQPETDAKNKQWVDVTKHRFINWMKSSSTSNFYKFWGRIPDGLQKGDYKLLLNNIANPKDTWEGEKNIVFSTTSRFGGRKFIPGFFCLGMGFVMLIVGCILLYLWLHPVKIYKETAGLLDEEADN